MSDAPVPPQPQPVPPMPQPIFPTFGAFASWLWVKSKPALSTSWTWTALLAVAFCLHLWHDKLPQPSPTPDQVILFTQSDYKTQPLVPVMVSVTNKGGEVMWISHGLDQPNWRLADGNSALFSSKAVGKYRVHAYTAVWGWQWRPPFVRAVPSTPTSCTITVGDVPPDPGPGPNPPDPPTPGTPFRVVLVPGPTMTAQQQAGMDSPEVRSYLDAKCQGGRAGWKRWQSDTDASQLPEWNDLWNQAKPKLAGASVVVFRGTVVDVKPLPADKAGILMLLKSYGG